MSNPTIPPVISKPIPRTYLTSEDLVDHLITHYTAECLFPLLHFDSLTDDTDRIEYLAKLLATAHAFGMSEALKSAQDTIREHIPCLDNKNPTGTNFATPSVTSPNEPSRT